MSILITGCSGYLGSRFLQWCKVNKQIECLGLSRSAESHFRLDLFDYNSLVKGLQNLPKDSTIFHFAGSPYHKNLADLYQSFIPTSLNLMNAASAVDKNFKIILIGSAAEYGNISNKPIDEDQIPKPCSSYGFIKSLQTELCFKKAVNNIDLICARIFNVISGNEPEGLFFGRLMSAIRNNNKLIKTGNLNLIRDYLLEEDVFEALYQLHKQFNKAKNSIYNISSGEGINLRFLTQEIVAASNSDIKIQETNLDFQPDIKTSIGDNSKIKEILDLDLNIDLIQIINQLQKF